MTDGNNSQSTIENSQCPTGTLLQLKPHQIAGFANGDICPFCKKQNIIYRSWRKDYYCGWCREVFTFDDSRVSHIGNQENMD